jgi:hypothetical protein
MFVMPLHHLAHDGLVWTDAYDVSHGDIRMSAPARPLPAAGAVANAIAAAQLHGVGYFEIVSSEPAFKLLTCSGDTCSEDRHLGFVSLQVEGTPCDGDTFDSDAAVSAVVCRSPDSRAVMYLALALAPVAGPLVVFDVPGEDMCVVSGTEEPGALVQVWPWSQPGRICVGLQLMRDGSVSDDA